MFLNFNAFDPVALTPFQVLGSVDFSLPNNTFSQHVDLFYVEMAQNVSPGQYFLDVVLEDFNGNLSDPITITYNVGVTSQVSAPQTALLVFGGLMWMRRNIRPLQNYAVV